jgi:hypothetical protein
MTVSHYRASLATFLNRSQLLNTFTNLGGTWPKFFVLKGRLDLLSGLGFSDDECPSYRLLQCGNVPG